MEPVRSTSNRNRPSVTVTIPKEQVDYLDLLASNSGRSRSVVLQDIIGFFMGMAINRVADGALFRKLVEGQSQEGKEM